jgi:DNA-binding response OmpR family regulator
VERAHVLVVADNAQTGEDLTTRLLPEAGYDVTLADADTRPPEDVDAVLVDVDRVLVSPLAGLQAQRRMGCQTPALLLAPRLNEEMASLILELNIRDFLTKPADEGEILEKVRNLLQFSHSERAQQETAERIRQHDEMLRRRLEETETLSAIARSLTMVNSLDTVLTRIVDAGVYLTPRKARFLWPTSSASSTCGQKRTWVSARFAC